MVRKIRFLAILMAIILALLFLIAAGRCLTVKGAEVKSLRIKNAPEQMTVGENLQLRISISPSSADDAELDWSSSNKDIATVNDKGFVKAKMPGTVKITVRAEDGSRKKDRVTIQVVEDTGESETSQSTSEIASDDQFTDDIKTSIASEIDTYLDTIAVVLVISGKLMTSPLHLC